MKKNYWIDYKIFEKKEVFPGLIRYDGGFRILEESEFKSKIKTKIKDGLVGLLIGGASILAGKYIDNHMPKTEDEKHFLNPIYIVAGISLASGAGKTASYFRHKNDKRPNSMDEAAVEIMKQMAYNKRKIK